MNDSYMACEDTVSFWIDRLLDEEIDDAKGAISNENIWLIGSNDECEEMNHVQNIADLEEYIARLKYMKKYKGQRYTRVSDDDRPEFIGQIIDLFEDFLEEKGIDITNQEKDASNNPAVIYGSDYGELSDGLEHILHAWNLL